MIDNLSSAGTLIFYKDKQDRAPINSRLPEDAFILCIQTSFQLDTFQRLGSALQLIMLRNIRIYCYLQSLQEIVGDMVSDE